MKLLHFEKLAPICPMCRAAGVISPLVLGRIEKGTPKEIDEGTILCSNSACQREYPIIGGIPIIVSAIRQLVEASLLPLVARQDFSASTLSILGDCSAPGSQYDTIRSQQSTYGHHHFEEFLSTSAISSQELSNSSPGRLADLTKTALDLVGPIPAGPQIDVGCGPGRTSWEMAKQLQERGSDDLVLGVDMSIHLLQLARDAMQKPQMTFPLRRVGMVYDYITARVPREPYERIDFWCCDATDLPFRDQQFSLAAAMNVLDSVVSPLSLLQSIARILQTSASAMIATPYDWSAAATPLEQWIGGHSQRSSTGGQSDAMLRQLLTPGMHPQSIEGLVRVAEKDHLPWRLRLHDRSSVTYDVHLTIAQRS